MQPYTAGSLLILLCFIILECSFCPRAKGQTYSIDWSTINGGGDTGAGGVYSVSGTVGQPDANGATTGGNYSVNDGFWSVAVVQTPGAPLLTLAHVGNQAIVSWPAAASGWILQTNKNLSADTWGNFSGGIVNNRMTNTLVNANLFFRLKQ